MRSSAAITGHPPLAGCVSREAAVDTYAPRRSSTAMPPGLAQVLCSRPSARRRSGAGVLWPRTCPRAGCADGRGRRPAHRHYTEDMLATTAGHGAVDNMTMAHGLAARVPLLDHEFVELRRDLPPDLKLRPGAAKGC